MYFCNMTMIVAVYGDYLLWLDIQWMTMKLVGRTCVLSALSSTSPMSLTVRSAAAVQSINESLIAVVRFLPTVSTALTLLRYLSVYCPQK